MNKLTTSNTQVTELTITSMQIAELVGARHDNVRRTIDNLASKSIIKCTAAEDIKGYRNKTTKVYALTERDSYVVVAQISPEFCAKLVDEWIELKSNTANAILQTMNPKQLRLVADVLEERNDAVSMIEEVKINSNHGKDIPTSDLARTLGLSPAKLFDILSKNGVIYKLIGDAVWKLMPNLDLTGKGIAYTKSSNIYWTVKGRSMITNSINKLNQEPKLITKQG